jgi:hypothetical protein
MDENKCKACGTPLELCLQEHPQAGDTSPLFAHCCPHCTHDRVVLQARLEAASFSKAVALVREREGASATRQGDHIALVVEDPHHVSGLTYQVELSEQQAAFLYAQLVWLLPTPERNPRPTAQVPSDDDRPEFIDRICPSRSVWRLGSEVVVRVTRFNHIPATVDDGAPKAIEMPEFWEQKPDGNRFAVDVDVWNNGSGWMNVLDKYRREPPVRLIGEAGREECELEALALARTIMESDW